MQSRPPDQGSTPTARLIALLICERIEDSKGPRGSTNLIGVHDRVELTPDEWGGRLVRACYAAYVGPFGEHDVRMRLIDLNTHSVVGEVPGERLTDQQMPDAPYYISIIELVLRPERPGNFELHLLIDGVDIGFTPFSYGQKP